MASLKDSPMDADTRRWLKRGILDISDLIRAGELDPARQLIQARAWEIGSDLNVVPPRVLMRAREHMDSVHDLIAAPELDMVEVYRHLGAAYDLFR